MSMRRLLFVDDEPSIRLTLPAILKLHGFEVSAAGTVTEALQAIQAQEFDVLLTDLNIGHPGDGFTVVSAMRSVQPDAVTIILTGYPAFETALEAIRSQVDDYIVKPANVETLVALIERKLLLETRQTRRIDLKRLSEVLQENSDVIAKRWLREMNQCPEFVRLRLDGTERCGYLADKLRFFAALLDGCKIGDDEVKSSREYGALRASQGATLGLLLEEARAARQVILAVVQENLLELDVSRLVHQIANICEWMDRMNAQALESYTQGWKRLQAG